MHPESREQRWRADAKGGLGKNRGIKISEKGLEKNIQKSCSQRVGGCDERFFGQKQSV